jgi:hypothetical protein
MLPVTQLLQAQMKAWGSLVALHIIRFGILPFNVSPFLILAVVASFEAITNVDFIQAIEGEGQQYLLQWIALAPDAILTQMDPLIAVVTQTLGTTVRYKLNL